MGIPLRLGREFRAGDDETAPRVVIVNESFARKFFPGENPLGHTIRMGTIDFRIAGVAADAKYNELTSDSPITFYFPFRQDPRFLRGMYFEARTALPPESLGAAARRAIAALDPNIPVTRMSTQARTIERSTARYTMLAALCTALAVLALLLSAIGLYGAMAYTVERRTREIAIRIALGARSGNVAGLVWREALLVAACGIAIGVAGAYAATVLLRSYLFGVELHAPVTLAGAAAVLAVVALLAALAPARRAAGLEPMEVLRRE